MNKIERLKKQIRKLADRDKDGPEGSERLRDKIDRKISILQKLDQGAYRTFQVNETMRREHNHPYHKCLGHFDPNEVEIKSKITFLDTLKHLLFPWRWNRT